MMARINRDFPFELLFMAQTNYSQLLSWFYLPIARLCKPFAVPKPRFSVELGLRGADFHLPTRLGNRYQKHLPLLTDVFIRFLSPLIIRLPQEACRRSIPNRMARNNFRGTAASAIWKTICRECQTTLAPILIGFSRNVVNVQ